MLAMVTVAGTREDGSLQRDRRQLGRRAILGRAALQSPLAPGVPPQLMEHQGSFGMVGSTNRSPGRRVVGAQTALEQPSSSQLPFILLPERAEPEDLLPWPGVRLFLLGPLILGVRRDQVVVLELLVPRHLSGLALLPGSPLAGLPPAFRGPRTLRRFPG